MQADPRACALLRLPDELISSLIMDLIVSDLRSAVRLIGTCRALFAHAHQVREAARWRRCIPWDRSNGTQAFELVFRGDSTTAYHPRLPPYGGWLVGMPLPTQPGCCCFRVTYGLPAASAPQDAVPANDQALELERLVIGVSTLMCGRACGLDVISGDAVCYQIQPHRNRVKTLPWRSPISVRSNAPDRLVTPQASAWRGLEWSIDVEATNTTLSLRVAGEPTVEVSMADVFGAWGEPAVLRPFVRFRGRMAVRLSGWCW